MKYTLKQQLDAVSNAMRDRSTQLRLWKGRELTSAEHLKDHHWAALNDAASTIAAIRMMQAVKKKK